MVQSRAIFGGLTETASVLFCSESACQMDKKHREFLEKWHRFAIRLASNDYIVHREFYAELLSQL